MQDNIYLSSLPHTWIIDVDGTICVHNGYKNGEDIILDGVKDFFSNIPSNDMIVILTSRKETEKNNLVSFLNENGLRFDHIIFGAPMGERILLNDIKPSGLKCAYAINKQRNSPISLRILIDGDK